MSGQVLGVAGHGVATGQDWAANDGVIKAGLQGELRTAAVLDEIAHRRGITVMHDLQIPGSRANIDHIVVTGNKVLLVDSKMWKPGFFWTWGGRTYRGRQRFESAEKQTMVMARQKIAAYLASSGLKVEMANPYICAWPSNDHTTMRTWALKFPGAIVLPGPKFGKRVQQHRMEPADPEIVKRLSALLTVQPSRSAASAAAPVAAGSRTVQGRRPAGPDGGQFAPVSLPEPNLDFSDLDRL